MDRMDRTGLARRSAAALAAHAPHVTGAVALAALALLVLPFDGPMAEFIIGFVGGRLGPRVAVHLSSSKS
ncbi:hypothetical protein [Streptomyces sp. A012304]|uniref:hypothetical protein n=1 Tax=Streptomyces sp. A012304 TaxID=375446 RepID=UPI00222EB417|nr:hypothetical protein [Streptomyces sp. A012304]GKQ35882.1 hypothetical protein ALMP_24250 [Streptomyces sp. A012304]